jgi:chromosome segregation ATPase
VRRIGASMVVVVGLMLTTGACDRADEIGGQVQDTVGQGVDAAREALNDAGDAISGATRATYEQVRSGVEELQADLTDAADQTGAQARQTYQDLLAKAEDLRQQADEATGEAKAEAQDAWRSIQAALEDLETRIRGAVDDLQVLAGPPFPTAAMDLAPSG